MGVLATWRRHCVRRAAAAVALKNLNDYASPEVSNIAVSMASLADFPAQTTN